MAATETAVPTLVSVVPTAATYRDRYRPTQPDMIDDGYGGTGLQVSNAADVAVSVANGGAIVQGTRYDLTGGPASLTVAANTGAANRYDVICLTYDSAHNPPVYLRTVAGTAGAGLPALTNSATGIWDFPIAHYEKQPGGALINLRDRRKFSDAIGGITAADDPTGTSGIGWFPPSPRTGHTIRFMPSGNTWTWTGTAWAMPTTGSVPSTVQAVELTLQTTSSATFVIGSPVCSVTFVAPVSGAVLITVEGRGFTAGADLAYSIGYQLRLTNSSGVIVEDNSEDATCAADTTNTSSMHRVYLPGLTPGVTYYMQTKHRSVTAGSSISVIGRQLIVEPVI
jgi:hypothetical protein